jgi:hypothetical protein
LGIKYNTKIIIINAILKFLNLSKTSVEILFGAVLFGAVLFGAVLFLNANKI